MGRPMRPNPIKPITDMMLLRAVAAVYDRRYFLESTEKPAVTDRRYRRSHAQIRRLYNRVKLFRVPALLARTVARRLCAAERDVIVEPRGRQVDHDKARLRICLEVSRILARRCADSGRQTILRVISD